MGRFWALWLLLWHLYVMGYPWSVTKYLDRDSRQACQLRFPSVNDNNSTTCTARAPPTRTHGLLYSMEDLGNSSLPPPPNDSFGQYQLWFYFWFWTLVFREVLTGWPLSSCSSRELVILQLPLTLEDNICPSKSKRPKWIEINKTLMRSSKKNRKRKHTQKTKKHNVNVKSLANGECDRPAAVL